MTVNDLLEEELADVEADLSRAYYGAEMYDERAVQRLEERKCELEKSLTSFRDADSDADEVQA